MRDITLRFRNLPNDPRMKGLSRVAKSQKLHY